MTHTVKIEEGKFKGTYEVHADGKVQQVRHAASGAFLLTVGRGTPKHNAVLSA